LQFGHFGIDLLVLYCSSVTMMMSIKRCLVGFIQIIFSPANYAFFLCWITAFHVNRCCSLSRILRLMFVHFHLSWLIHKFVPFGLLHRCHASLHNMWSHSKLEQHYRMNQGAVSDTLSLDTFCTGTYHDWFIIGNWFLCLLHSMYFVYAPRCCIICSEWTREV